MEQIPHKCPVCDGEGVRTKWSDLKIEAKEEECRACNGMGVVWGWKSTAPQYPPVQPSPWWGIYPPPQEPYWMGQDNTSVPIKVKTTGGTVDADGNISFAMPEQWTHTQ